MLAASKNHLIISSLVISLLAIFISHGLGILQDNNTLYAITLLYIGGLLGASLNYFHFGFSNSFRSFISQQKTIGMRSIVIMLGLAIVFFSLLQSSSSPDNPYHGYIRTLSLAIPIGAFIFGIGMQLSCGCTSGTFNRLGQLQPLALPTIVFMIIGGVIAAMSMDLWRELPSFEPIAFQQSFSWPLAIIIQLSILGLLYFVLHRTESQKNKLVEPLFSKKISFKQHPLLSAAIVLASLNALLFLVSGFPWAISSVFPFWGIKTIELFSLPVDWSFWEYSIENQQQLTLGIFENPISLTTIGLILGALTVTLVQKNRLSGCSKKALLGSIVGGLIMGFSAVLASGCNIGAFFSGIASGSLHGWVWLVFALLGNVIGVWLRNRLLN